jgi:hypothetical protein
MAVKRLKREGVRQEDTGAPLLQAIAGRLDQCSDDLGIFGCLLCPVQNKCYSLWREVVSASIAHFLKAREFKQYSQRFYLLKEERNRIIEREAQSRCVDEVL